VHPDYQQNNYIYLYMTMDDPESDGLINRVVRYTLQEDRLANPATIIEGIPGAQYHDGGRIHFGPDNRLYITTGDSGDAQRAQDRDSLAGKLLRLNPDGSIPQDNPFGTPIYSYGHRNPQGLAWDSQGQLWATEHGSNARDEINVLRARNNYGWPVIEGQENRQGMQPPVRSSGRFTTWAPAGTAIVDDHLVFAGLRGASLYVADIQGSDIGEIEPYFDGVFGRLRAVEQGPDGMLYVSTSNRDGRGNPQTTDDRILRIEPSTLW
jgi:glucose/arabinose dehydrogenase